MSVSISRRELLAGLPCVALGAGVAGAAQPRPVDQTPGGSNSPFLFGLNTSTVMGQKLPITEIVAIAAKAGYNALEPWIRELEAHKAAGKSLADLKKQIADAGISVESAIGFTEWAVDDEARRKKGLEQMKRDMDLVASIGGKRIAAPPVGLTDRHESDILKLADRYRAICELGDQAGVVAEAELWGFSKTMSRLGEVMAIVIESNHPKACMLPDVYHLYKGGSVLTGLSFLTPLSFHVIHMNDYPSDPPRATIKDEHRVYPGDGVAPIVPLLRDLATRGFKITLSLEVFNREYWKRDAAEVCATGLAKMKKLVSAALAS